MLGAQDRERARIIQGRDWRDRNAGNGLLGRHRPLLAFGRYTPRRRLCVSRATRSVTNLRDGDQYDALEVAPPPGAATMHEVQAMTFERMPGPAGAEPAPPVIAGADGGGSPVALRLQVLATEHWGLLATRSLAWNESFTRAGMFLTTLSGAIVALALVAQATEFGGEFVLFALVILPGWCCSSASRHSCEWVRRTTTTRSAWSA